MIHTEEQYQNQLICDVTKMITKYNLVEDYHTLGNERKAWVGYLEDEECHVRVSQYGSNVSIDSWYSITISFGELRTTTKSKTRLGENGIAYASSSIKALKPCYGESGCAIPGNNMYGLRWRVMYLAPKSRTSCGIDRYVRIQHGDIIGFLIANKSLVKDNASEDDLFFGGWDNAKPNWHGININK